MSAEPAVSGPPSQWLRRQREAAGLTQEELAERCGLSVRAIRDLERGIRRPHPRSIRLLTGALGLPKTAGDELIVRYRAGHGQAVAPDSLPGPAVLPRELPAAVANFAGRAAELARLDGWLEQTSGYGAGPAVVISAIGGMAGVGKTTLALRWAHQVAGRFPDGQLYVNLRGYESSGPPADAGAVVRRFLDALGVARERIPADSDGQAGLYRSLLAGKRMLIVADNARDAAQVRPLLPGTPGSLVLVTSRGQLSGLAAADGARVLQLDVLSGPEAAELLGARLGASRVAAEPAAVAELIRLCGQLPLALAITAARAAASAGPLAAVAAELAGQGERLDALGLGDATTDVRAVFSWSCRQLSTGAARMFRLLGLHPGPDIGAPAAASLAAVPPRAARAALRELAEASLITERVPGRYALHDLLRVYAAEQAEAGETAAERRSAVGRMLDHYLHTAERAARATDPDPDIPACGAPRAGVTPEVIAAPEDALAWLRAEHKVLLAAIGQAARSGFDTHAQQLPWILVGFLDRGGHWPDLAHAQQLALDATGRLGDRRGQARAHHGLGRARARLGQDDLALAHLGQAVELSRRLGDQVAQARAHISLSVLHESRGQLDEALSSSLRALDLAQAAGHPVLRAHACNNVGYDYAVLGDLQQALSYCRRALAEHEHIDSPTLAASAWDSLGYVQHRLGDYRQATGSYRRALGLYGPDNRYQRAQTLSSLGDTCRAAGEAGAARDAWRQALATLDDLAHPAAGQVRGKLVDLARGQLASLPAGPDVAKERTALDELGDVGRDHVLP
jgi:tetratricopeptide (TPR) repeat protein/transcriptional regulator with XRE-family HTH domain